ALATPSAPSCATVTTYPSFLRLNVSVSRMVASSSTTRMRLGNLTQLHDPSGVEEDDVFGDIRHPVGDPLQVLGEEEQDGRPLHVYRLLHHEAAQLVPDLVVERVDLVVAFSDGARAILVGLDHRAQDLVHLRFGDRGHLGQVDVGFELRQVVEPERGPGDAYGMVAHPLQLEHHVLKADDQTQVAGHRLLGGHDHEGALPQLAVQLVDLLVAGNHLLGERVVAIDQGAHRLGDRLFDHAAHADDTRLQLGKLV